MRGDITTVTGLEDRIGKASALVHMKSIDHLDEGALGWVRAAPLMVCGLGAPSRLGVTLGGGPAGWADGDRHTLRLPASKIDDPALATPGAGFGSIFMIPSISELMRINGRVVDADADTIRVQVQECYFHCGKALIRSGFWGAQPGASVPDDPSAFAEESRFLALATVDAEGRADLSPKGDPAGAMAHLQGDTLWFADRPGNRRIDSFRNIVTQPRVAAALMIPGSARVVMLSGLARISEAEEVRTAFTVQDKTPALVTGIGDIAVEVRESAALARAGVWPAPAAPADIDPAKIGVAHLKLSKGLAASLAGAVLSVPGLMKKGLEADYKKNLY